MPSTVVEPAVAPHPPGPGPGSHGPRRRFLPVVPVAGALVALALLVALLGRGLDLLPDGGNPTEPGVVDRSGPSLLLALADLSEYHAATGSFQVVIDVERDTPYLPSVLSGERTTFLATGGVDAVVDFSGLTAERVQVSQDRRAVTFSLPAPRLTEARVDPDGSRVVGRDRGLVDRIASVFEDNPTSEREFYQLAEQRLATAARDSDLLARAETNTRAMLTGLAGSLGFERVRVDFAAPARG